MSALDYFFFDQGNGLRLKGQCRSGWTKGQFGSYYQGICTFDWRAGMKCRADLKLNGASLEGIEAMDVAVKGDGAMVSWQLADGFITVDLPILITKPEVALHPSWRSTGYQKATITHQAYASAGTQLISLKLAVFLKWDVDRPEVVAWAKGSGMASAGLPSLGKHK
jgi:hypothetical protein